MQSQPSASTPEINATVSASAGTGKTWQLVTRLIRLLLAGAPPDAILAITFTRKAAGEMHTRLRERLFELAQLEGTALTAALTHMGIAPDENTLAQAPTLYEKLLRSDRRMRLTTFHAFCQEILRRFPLEAGIPAGFDIIEQEGMLQDQAWEALIDDATSSPEGETAQTLTLLLEYCNGAHNMREALSEFLNHRSDWWAYTHNQYEAVSYACHALETLLDIDADSDPVTPFFSDINKRKLERYAGLMVQHVTKTNQKNSEAILTALHLDNLTDSLNLLADIFLDDDGDPKSIKISNALTKSLGADLQEYLELHNHLADRICKAQDQLHRRHTLKLSRAWFIAGTKLIEHYQRLKTEQRALDFADLEWKTYLLLTHADQAQWVQYKLDQRIDHLLIDEFQDTNPTQWRLLLPLLEELAAGQREERRRSVFLVGDAKQSIYRFRRADPHLFDAAGTWLKENLDARQFNLDESRRSAPAIIDFVNRVFNSPSGASLKHFHPHSAHQKNLWGKVEILPLVRATEKNSDAAPKAFRNPLLEPRMIHQDQRHYDEGRQIAAQIQALIAGGIIGPDKETRKPGYSDIMILVRNRTHVHAYESALREAGIPYLGAHRGSLLECQEVKDMVALLKTLTMPYDSLSLATGLRSPVFACSDDDLMQIARCVRDGASRNNWFECLLNIGPQQPPDSPLARAAKQLAEWHDLAGRLPGHDLLDHIYCAAGLIERYEAAFPPHLKARVRANLLRFLDLALEVDSGRYPTLMRFLDHLPNAQERSTEAPDEAPALPPEGGVRLMTIHAAKGLEAPIVFLADTASTGKNEKSYQPMITWPADQPAPTRFFISASGKIHDSITRRLLAEQRHEERHEEANLLYVALTRAKQMLFISGCEPQRGDKVGWYGEIIESLGDMEEIKQNGWRLESNSMPALSKHKPPQPISSLIPDPRLSRPLPPACAERETSPSRTLEPHAYTSGVEDEAQRRGTAIHRLLELMNKPSDITPETALRRIGNEMNGEIDEVVLKQCWREAEKILRHPGLRTLYDRNHYVAAYNEAPIQYLQQGRMIHGVIDRLVVHEDEVLVIDYKTHRGATEKNLAALAAPYYEQMRLYAEGARLLWPDKKIRPMLLFTACAGMYEIKI